MEETYMRSTKIRFFALVVMAVLMVSACAGLLSACNFFGGGDGDGDGDGEINNKDIAVIMQHINGWNTEIDETAADVNLDGKINNKDYALLMQYVNGWDVFIG
jgi:hypothetical protein